MTIKTIERQLNVGKWRIFLGHDMKDHELLGVYLKGMRNRPFPVMKASPETFFERAPKDENGQPYDTPSMLRGVPVMYLQQGTTVFLWPAPSHEWKLELRLRYKYGKAEANVVVG